MLHNVIFNNNTVNSAVNLYRFAYVIKGIYYLNSTYTTCIPLHHFYIPPFQFPPHPDGMDLLGGRGGLGLLVAQRPAPNFTAYSYYHGN